MSLFEPALAIFGLNFIDLNVRVLMDWTRSVFMEKKSFDPILLVLLMKSNSFYFNFDLYLVYV